MNQTMPSQGGIQSLDADSETDRKSLDDPKKF